MWASTMLAPCSLTGLEPEYYCQEEVKTINRSHQRHRAFEICAGVRRVPGLEASPSKGHAGVHL